MKKTITLEKIMPAIVSLILPMMAVAAVANVPFLETLKNVMNAIIGVLFVVVTLFFIWGVVQYIMASGDETKVKAGKQHMIWGIIGMAVMVGVWALVKVIVDALGLGGVAVPTSPGLIQ